MIRYSKPKARPTTELWDDFFLTPPAYTKPFKRKGGFEGTSLTTMYVIERLTESFGPFGKGWWMKMGTERIVEAGNGEVLIFIPVTLCYVVDGESVVREAGPQWGGDYIVTKAKDGSLRSDDESFKKAATDGLLKCAAWLGIGADVHYGLHDDNKYLAHANQQEAKRRDDHKPAKPPVEQPDTLAKLRQEMHTKKAELDVRKNGDPIYKDEFKRRLGEWTCDASNEQEKIQSTIMGISEWLLDLDRGGM